MSDDMELNSVTEKKIYKTKKNISGTKARYISKISRDLRQQMIQNGATKEELTRFQYDFLIQNGINVPESFLNIRKNDDEYEILGKFIEKNLKASEENLSGSYFYKKYIEYCINNQFRHIGKQEAFAYLRGKGLMKKSGTINGKTVRNVVIGYDFNLEGFCGEQKV